MSGMIGFVCSRIFCQKLLQISLEASHSSIPRKIEFSRNHFLRVTEASLAASARMIPKAQPSFLLTTTSGLS